METLVIKDILPNKAGDETSTPGRRFLQIIFKFASQEGYFTTKPIRSRNFWDAFMGGKRKEDGADLNINADQLFLSICEYLNITSDNIDSIPWEKETFKRAIGMKVKGDTETHYVKGYSIPGSLSKLDIRYRYSMVVLEGEDANGVFRAQGHVIVNDPEEIKEIQRKLEEIANINEEAREERQRERGIAPPNERRGNGNITAERSLATGATLDILRDALNDANDIDEDNNNKDNKNNKGNKKDNKADKSNQLAKE